MFYFNSNLQFIKSQQSQRTLKFEGKRHTHRHCYKPLLFVCCLYILLLDLLYVLLHVIIIVMYYFLYVLT